MRSPREMLGERIRIVRESHGLTQGQLAKAAGTTPKTIVSIEKGHKSARVDVVFEIAKQLGVDPGALMGIAPAWLALIEAFPTLDEDEAEYAIRSIRTFRQVKSSLSGANKQVKKGTGS